MQNIIKIVDMLSNLPFELDIIVLRLANHIIKGDL
jgi:hypothetical protein